MVNGEQQRILNQLLSPRSTRCTCTLYIFVLFCNSFHSVLTDAELHDLCVQVVAGHVTFERQKGSI